MTTKHAGFVRWEDRNGTALGHLQRGMETTVRVPIWTSGPGEGQIHELLLLSRLQDLALVSPDVRGVYVEPDDDGGGWSVMDVDTGDSVAWISLPMGAGF